MKETTNFKLLRWGAGIWVRRHCNVIYFGLENLNHNKKENRIYIIDHPTTYDAFVLLHISEEPVCFVMLEEVFGYPLIGKMLASAGNIPLVKGKGDEAIERGVEAVKKNIPLLYALRAGRRFQAVPFAREREVSGSLMLQKLLYIRYV